MPSSAPTDLYTLSLHDALPIYALRGGGEVGHLASNIVEYFPRPVQAGLFQKLPVKLSFGEHAGGRANRPAKRLQPVFGVHVRALRSEEHTSELQSPDHLVCRLLRPPISTPFPYTTLFRSTPSAAAEK